MKVRWTRDSLRLRITPSEMAAVQSGESATAAIGFPGGLIWTVTLGPSAEATGLNSSDQGVFLSLSAADLAALALPEAEGVYFQTDGPQPLRYYVEKDYPCVHPRAGEAGEAVTETFAAPEGHEMQEGVPEINGD